MSEATPGEVRERVWVALQRAGAVAYPVPAFGHHPNFRGAGQAAELLLPELFARGFVKPGDTVLSYPDYVLKGLRKGLLEGGVSVVVPAKHGDDYRLLTSGKVAPAKASSIAGAEKVGERITELPSCRLALVACVAVSAVGAGLGKGYGFGLPEQARGLPLFTLVHDLQVVAAVPEPEHDLTAFATPTEVVWCANRGAQSEG
ncbi:5-formyltetrahydrofolate cyclo-ligase [soil metagenome]